LFHEGQARSRRLTPEQLVADVSALGSGLPVQGHGVALENGPLEHTGAERRGHVGSHAHGAGRLTEDGDPLRVTTKAKQRKQEKKG